MNKMIYAKHRHSRIVVNLGRREELALARRLAGTKKKFRRVRI